MKILFDNIYNKYSGFSKLKGYIVSACDGSIVDIPNVTLTFVLFVWFHWELALIVDIPNVTLTRIQFPVDDEGLLKEKRIRARVSCFLDVHSKHILTAKNCWKEQ